MIGQTRRRFVSAIVGGRILSSGSGKYPNAKSLRHLRRYERADFLRVGCLSMNGRNRTTLSPTIVLVSSATPIGPTPFKSRQGVGFASRRVGFYSPGVRA